MLAAPPASQISLRRAATAQPGAGTCLLLQHIPNGSGRRGLLAGPCSAPKVKPTPSCNGGGLTVAVGGDAGTRCSRRSCVQAAAPGINLRRVVRSVRSRWCQGLMLYQVLRPAGREGSWDAEAPVHGISREHPRKVGCPALQRCSRCSPQPPALGVYPLQRHQGRMRPCTELVWVKHHLHRWLCAPCCHPSPPWVPVMPGPG